MNELPLVSVILPVYNASQFLREAIESILNQTYKNLEIIVINDCSTDNSLEIISEYAELDHRVIVKNNPENIKLSKTLNLAISLASGKYLARMDADDISAPKRIELQVELMERIKGLVVTGCDISIINEEGSHIGFRKYYATDSEIRKRMFYFSPFCHPAIMVRRDAIEKIGGYDHHFNPAEDYELYFRLGTIGKLMNIEETLFSYRIVGNSMTHGNTLNMEKKTIEIRSKYSKKYRMTIAAMICNFAHKVSISMISPSGRVKVFSYIRQRLSRQLR